MKFICQQKSFSGRPEIEEGDFPDYPFDENKKTRGLKEVKEKENN